MDKIEVTAIKGHTYDNVWREPGVSYEARKRLVPVLVGMGRVSIGSSVVAPSAAPAVAVSSPLKQEVSTLSEMDKEALRAEYKNIYGKNAAGRMSEDGLREAIANFKEGENESE